MNRMERVFAELSERNEKILILYFPIQDTILEDDVEWAKKYFQGGCTFLEIGLPNDNPLLDGKTVRESMERALAHSDLDKVFSSIRRIREQCPDNILQIMTYYHIIDNMGMEVFAEKCRAADVDAVLSPNVPAKKMGELDEALERYGIINLRFVPYHLTDEIVGIWYKMPGDTYLNRPCMGGLARSLPYLRKLRKM